VSASSLAQTPQARKDAKSLVAWITETHKAPFHRDAALPAGAAEIFQEAQARRLLSTAAPTPAFKNVKINQDRNPWPKSEIAASVDPSNPKNYVVMTNDYRLTFDHEFFHVSTDGGQTWTDEAMAGGHPSTSGGFGTFQSAPGVSFDRIGHSYLSTISGNQIADQNNHYFNSDTEVEVVQGEAHGTYARTVPIPIDEQPCNSVIPGIFNCPAVLDKPLITTDTSQTATDGTTYVYYTLFCNDQPCTDGNATIPKFSSAIFESHSPGAGLPFSTPALVSGSLANTQFADMVIDNEGIPHIFFDDFTDPQQVRMFESTLQGSTWVVSKQPVAVFTFTGLNNIQWSFFDGGTVAPGCGIHAETAYCAFSANQIGNGPSEPTPSVYLAIVDLDSGKSSITRVNNDPFRDGKDHFFPWATATPDGSVYVGWYDDRNDPFNAKVEYFVAKSTNGGSTFIKQQAVNDVPFNPCIGFPDCRLFGDYTQIVSGPDGVVHAAWTDTRDSASQQIWGQELKW
jgi:hypothetical protein